MLLHLYLLQCKFGSWDEATGDEETIDNHNSNVSVAKQISLIFLISCVHGLNARRKIV